MDTLITTGVVLSSHGVHGYVKVQSLSGEMRHFRRMKKILLVHDQEKQEFQVDDFRPNGKTLLMKLKGIDSPEEAKAYANWHVQVRRKHAAALKKGEFYAADIEGCDLVKGDETLGTVVHICDYNGHLFIEAKNLEGAVTLIPYQDRYVGAVNIKKRRIELLADWLLR